MYHYPPLAFGKMYDTYTYAPNFIHNLGWTSRPFVHAFMRSLVCINIWKLLWFSKDRNHSNGQNNIF